MPQTADVIIFSGLLGGSLAFISSVVATVMLFVTSRKQLALQAQLQRERISFDERMAEQLQKHKLELDSTMRALDAELRVNADHEIQKLQKVFEHVFASQAAVQKAVASFRSLLNSSFTAENRDFLVLFQSAIAVLQQLTDEVVKLGNLVHAKDLLIVNRMTKVMLQILLGMRLEKERRNLDDFKEKVLAYQRQLEHVDLALTKKYRRFLQPSDLPSGGAKRNAAILRAAQNVSAKSAA
jgi:Skp family chaperone for outer membrane proteins